MAEYQLENISGANQTSVLSVDSLTVTGENHSAVDNNINNTANLNLKLSAKQLKLQEQEKGRHRRMLPSKYGKPFAFIDTNGSVMLEGLIDYNNLDLNDKTAEELLRKIPAAQRSKTKDALDKCLMNEKQYGHLIQDEDNFDGWETLDENDFINEEHNEKPKKRLTLNSFIPDIFQNHYDEDEDDDEDEEEEEDNVEKLLNELIDIVNELGNKEASNDNQIENEEDNQLKEDEDEREHDIYSNFTDAEGEFYAWRLQEGESIIKKLKILRADKCLYQYAEKCISELKDKFYNTQ